MKVVLYSAVSIDGYIATKDGDTNWVKDWKLFKKTSKEFGCTVMGQKTLEEGDAIFKSCQHLVLTHKANQVSKYPNVHFVGSPSQALQKARSLGFQKLLVVGGGRTNGSFAKAGLVDEVWVDVHQVVLGEGIKMLTGFSGNLGLELSANKKYKGFVQCKFEVKSGKQAKQRLGKVKWL